VNVLSLFAGIGGLELGLERAGMTTVGQVEIDPYCQRVLARHWPEVPRHDDVRTTPAWWLGEPRPTVDVVCGGFPCQPFSTAGKMLGVGDERWGWPWMADAVRTVRPRYVVMENVPTLIRDARAFGAVLGDLSELGFDAEWSVIPASAFGASHRRPRLFVLAYANQSEPGRRSRLPEVTAGERDGNELADAHRCRSHLGGATNAESWPSEPDVGRMADGFSGRVDRRRLYALGNAVVPAVAEHIGRLIVEDAAWRAWVAA
jgi:DNA (cytosine-5)-methyltransferase 1